MPNNANIDYLQPLAEEVPEDWIYPVVDDSDGEVPNSEPSQTKKKANNHRSGKAVQKQSRKKTREVPILTLPKTPVSTRPTYANILKSNPFQHNMNIIK